MREQKKRGCRYQPVWQDGAGGRVYSICEVWIDENDALEVWTDPYDYPAGETICDLGKALVMMCIDARRWAPVDYSSLHVGMKFDLLISRREAEEMAEMLEAVPLREREHGRAPETQGAAE